MKKIKLFISSIVICSAPSLTYSNSYSSLYTGISAGFIKSATSSVETQPSNIYANPSFNPNASVVANSFNSTGANNEKLSQQGGIYDLLIGYNKLYEKIFFGFEAAYEFNDITKSIMFTRNASFGASGLNYDANFKITKKITYLIPIKAKIGLYSKDKLLVYATGGAVAGKNRLTTSINIDNVGSPSSFMNSTNTSTDNKNMLGWVLGIGTERFVNNKFTIKLEYLYYYLGNMLNNTAATKIITIPSVQTYASSDIQTKTKFSYHSIKFGINYYPYKSK